MKNQREILSIIDQAFEKKIKLDWLGFLHNSYKYDSNSGSFYRKIKSLKRVDVILYSYGWEGDWEVVIDPYLNTNRVQSWVIFEEVSEILFSILQSRDAKFEIDILYGLSGATLTTYPNLNKNQNWLSATSNDLVLYKDNQLQIDNIELTSQEIFNYISTNHLPFFDRVSSLQVVNDEIIDKVPQMELANYIPGKYMNPKKLIIMKLCDNPKYDEFKSWLIEIFESVIKAEPDRYLEDYKIALATIEYLDSGKYKALL